MGKDDSKGMNLEVEISKLEEQLREANKKADLHDGEARFAIFAGTIPCLAGIATLFAYSVGGLLWTGGVVGIEEGSIGIDVNNCNFTIPMVMFYSGLVTTAANALAMYYLERKVRKGEKNDKSMAK